MRDAGISIGNFFVDTNPSLYGLHTTTRVVYAYHERTASSMHNIILHTSSSYAYERVHSCIVCRIRILAIMHTSY